MRIITAIASGLFNDQRIWDTPTIDVMVDGLPLEMVMLNNSLNARLDEAEAKGQIKRGPFGEVIFTDKQT
jgi:hypothetical protein